MANMSWYRANSERAKATARQYYQANIERLRAYGRKYHQDHRDHCNAKNREYKKKNQNTAWEMVSRNKIKLTREEVRNLKLAGNCKICGTFQERLIIDHNHRTLEFRGLLCRPCNTGLGMFRDDPNILRKAFEHITSEFLEEL